MKVVGQLFYGAYKFVAAFTGGENERAGAAAAPAAQGKNYFQPGVLIFQLDHMPDSGRVFGGINKKAIAIEMTEAEQDMGELAGGETVQGGASAGIIADDGGLGGSCGWRVGRFGGRG